MLIGSFFIRRVAPLFFYHPIFTIQYLREQLSCYSATNFDNVLIISVLLMCFLFELSFDFVADRPVKMQMDCSACSIPFWM